MIKRSPPAKRPVIFRHSRPQLFSKHAPPTIDYKDIPLLQKFLSERQKIIPKRITLVTAKKQRQIAKAIKYARYLALLPYKNS